MLSTVNILYKDLAPTHCVVLVLEAHVVLPVLSTPAGLKSEHFKAHTTNPKMMILSWQACLEANTIIILQSVCFALSVISGLSATCRRCYNFYLWPEFPFEVPAASYSFVLNIYFFVFWSFTVNGTAHSEWVWDKYNSESCYSDIFLNSFGKSKLLLHSSWRSVHGILYLTI